MNLKSTLTFRVKFRRNLLARFLWKMLYVILLTLVSGNVSSNAGLPTFIDISVPILVLNILITSFLLLQLYIKHKSSTSRPVITIGSTVLSIILLGSLNFYDQNYFTVTHAILGFLLILAVVFSATEFSKKLRVAIGITLLLILTYIAGTNPGLINIYEIKFIEEEPEGVELSLVEKKSSIHGMFEVAGRAYRVDSSIKLNDDKVLYGVFSSIHEGDVVIIENKTSDNWDFQLSKLNKNHPFIITPYFRIRERAFFTHEINLITVSEVVGWAYDFDKKRAKSRGSRFNRQRVRK